jgi:hypothetical protein
MTIPFATASRFPLTRGCWAHRRRGVCLHGSRACSPAAGVAVATKQRGASNATGKRELQWERASPTGNQARRRRLIRACYLNWIATRCARADPKRGRARARAALRVVCVPPAYTGFVYLRIEPHARSHHREAERRECFRLSEAARRSPGRETWPVILVASRSWAACGTEAGGRRKRLAWVGQLSLYVEVRYGNRRPISSVDRGSASSHLRVLQRH